MFKTYSKEINLKSAFKTGTKLKNETNWMKEVNSAAIQQKEIDFKKQLLFSKSRRKKIDFPKFKKKNNNHLGYPIGKVRIVVDRV